MFYVDHGAEPDCLILVNYMSFFLAVLRTHLSRHLPLTIMNKDNINGIIENVAVEIVIKS